MFNFTNYTTRRLIGLKNDCYISDYEHTAGDPTLAEIKAELNNRPHVPNKQEAKKIRQERAKNGRKTR